MSTANFIGRVGALAVALGLGVAGIAPGAATAEQADPVESTALIMCGTTCPTPDEYWIESVMNQFITPTHSGQTITAVPLTTPEEAWPITGLLRLIELVLADPNVGRPGGAVWPDEPWWKLTGFFDVTFEESIQAGAADLEAAIAEHADDRLIIYGNSQSAIIANLVKVRLAEQYPAGTTAPDIDFVLESDLNVPNGGLGARFPGLFLPIVGTTFTRPAPTDTQFDTAVIIRQYDGATDFPLYPLNVVSLLNAGLGVLYLHTNPFDVSLAPDPSTSSAITSQYGDTTFYFFETDDLPLFAPLRMFGVPEALIDVVEPFFKVLVELGYDRTIPLGEPTPARLIPTLDPAKVITDLVNAIGEGFSNALGLVASPATAKTQAVQEVSAFTASAPESSPAAPTGPPAELDQAASATPDHDSGPSAPRTRELSTAPSTLAAPEVLEAPSGRSEISRSVDEATDETDGLDNAGTAVTADSARRPINNVEASPRPGRNGPRNQAIRPWHGNDTPDPGGQGHLGHGPAAHEAEAG